MREIKFRVWDVQRKVLANVTSIMWLSEDEIEIDHDKNGLREPFQIHEDTAILEQFTGEKCYVTHSDLYVGDIMERNLELFVIEFKHGSFVCRSVDKPHKSYSLSIFTSVTSVGNAGAKIGNIHDNPKLLS